MTTERVEPRPWTRRRWIYTVAAVLLLQAGLTALLVRPAPRTPARPSFGARLHLIVDADPGRPLAALPAFVDPGLFSLPSLEGFSGAAWLRYPLLEHAPTERAESPEWLRLRPAALGAAFSARHFAPNAAPGGALLRWRHDCFYKRVRCSGITRRDGWTNGKFINFAVPPLNNLQG